MSGSPGGFGMPPVGQPGDEAPYEERAELEYGGRDESGTSGSSAVAVLRSWEHEVMSIDGVTGAGIGDGDLGEDAIVVYVRDAAVGERLPRAVKGIPVRIVVTGEITPY